MPTIYDNPPENIQVELQELRAALDQSIPSKKLGQNLLIATWNLRTFGSLTREWTADVNATPKRDLRAILAIGEIISRFDVIAIQEVVGDLRSLRDTLKLLGDDWAFLMTDENHGAVGKSERIAFIFDQRRVKPSGLACEIVLPPEWLEKVDDPDALKHQFARTPYAVSFLAGRNTFILISLHVLYGNAGERVPELTTIARWMANWAKRASDWEHNLLSLGDFNIDRKDDDLWKAFTSTGLSVPEDLQNAPRTIFSDPAHPHLNKFYDQIAWFKKANGQSYLSMEYLKGGNFDFLPFVYRNTGFTKNAISFRISDHYPLWVEFGLQEN